MALAVAVPEIAALVSPTARVLTIAVVVTAAPLSARPAHTAIVPTTPIATAPAITGTRDFLLDFSPVSGPRSVAATSARGVTPPLLPPALAARRAFALGESDGGGTEITVPARSTRYISTASRIEAADAKRSAGSIFSALATRAFNFASASGRRAVTGGAGVITIFTMTAACVGAMCAGSPTSNS